MCVCHGDPDGQFGGKETGQAAGKQAGKRVLRGLILTAAASIEKWVKRERVREGGEGERERERKRRRDRERGRCEGEEGATVWPDVWHSLLFRAKIGSLKCTKKTFYNLKMKTHFEGLWYCK
jgi:hypothetical protein